MRAVVACILLVPLLVTSPARGEIYRWVDEHGRVNFDDDLARVPENQRPAMKVFQSKAAPPPAALDDARPSQAAFARALARDLGLVQHENQDPVSVLQVVGVYPAVGWHPAAPLVPAVVDEVVRAAVAAARASRVAQSPASAEAAVLRVAEGLGVAGPPPALVAEPLPPPEPAPIIVAPNIVVEAPPPTVVVQEARPAPFAGYYVGSQDPAFAFGVPFRPFRRGGLSGPVPARIPPLSNPSGHLHGPVIEPLRARPFQRPLGR